MTGPCVAARCVGVVSGALEGAGRARQQQQQRQRWQLERGSESSGQSWGARQQRLRGARPGAPAAAVRSEAAQSEETSKEKRKRYSDANFPVDPDGRTYHLSTKVGEVANRVLTVGDLGRAERLSELLEPPVPGGSLFVRQSSRGFVTITGRYRGTPLSIITSLMGTPNMDMTMRETRAVVDGQMAVVRLGTCGILSPDVPVGTLLVAANGSVSIIRNPDAFADRVLGDDGSIALLADTIDEGIMSHYIITQPVPADQEVSSKLVAALQAAEGVDVVSGLNATACSFYSSQGRVDESFMDCNRTLLQELAISHPELASLEMETFQLLDLARCSRGSIKASAVCIGLAQRSSNAFLDMSLLPDLEQLAGKAVMEALVALEPLQDDASIGSPRVGVDYVWA